MNLKTLQDAAPPQVLQLQFRAPVGLNGWERVLLSHSRPGRRATRDSSLQGPSHPSPSQLFRRAVCSESRGRSSKGASGEQQSGGVCCPHQQPGGKNRIFFPEPPPHTQSKRTAQRNLPPERFSCGKLVQERFSSDAKHRELHRTSLFRCSIPQCQCWWGSCSGKALASAHLLGHSVQKA